MPQLKENFTERTYPSSYKVDFWAVARLTNNKYHQILTLATIGSFSLREIFMNDHPETCSVTVIIQHEYIHTYSVVDPKLFISDPDPTLTLISDPDSGPDSDPDSVPDCL